METTSSKSRGDGKAGRHNGKQTRSTKSANPDGGSMPAPLSLSIPPTVARPSPASPRSDEDLIAEYRSGDKASFAMLVERYHRELFHFLVRFLGDRAAAEDVFQETFLQIHQSADQFDP